MSSPQAPRIVELAGTPWERGRRHGELLAQEIRGLRRTLIRYLSRLTLYIGAWPLLALAQRLALLSFWPFLPARVREELIGVAAGAGLGLPLVLLINTLDDLANNLASCSALAVGQDRTSEGLYLAGRNLDYPVFVDALIGYQTLFLITPERGVPLASLAWPGYVGVTTGLNRAGVAVAQLASMCRGATRKGLPAGLRYRQALEQGSTVEEVAGRVLASPGTIGNNVLLTGPRDALVLEISARCHARRRPAAGLLTVTNHFQSPEMVREKGRFRRRPPFSVLEPYHFTEAYSQARNTRLQELAARRPLAPADLQAILGDPGIANPGTANSVVFVPAELTLWIAAKGPPPVSRGKFIKFCPWAR
ncbi:MAG: C45 family autoproteolytic acyltransferase/hydrolase [Thermodesulfobacteriota bacterium]